MLNLETHILIKAFDGSLTPRERNVLAEDPEWAISAIVLLEVANGSRKASRTGPNCL